VRIQIPPKKKPNHIGDRADMCPPGKYDPYPCIRSLLHNGLSAAAFTTPICSDDCSIRVNHNRQTIEINLTAEARVRCWSGNTHIDGLFNPLDVKAHQRKNLAKLDRRLRRAIKDIKETTKVGKTEDTKSRTGVDNAKPADGTLAESCPKQDAVQQAEPRTSTTILTSDNHVTSNQNEVGRIEREAADTAGITTTAAGQEDNKGADVLSPLLASTSRHAEVTMDGPTCDAGEQAMDCDWDLVDAKEAVAVSKPKKVGWGQWAQGWTGL